MLTGNMPSTLNLSFKSVDIYSWECRLNISIIHPRASNETLPDLDNLESEHLSVLILENIFPLKQSKLAKKIGGIFPVIQTLCVVLDCFTIIL